MLEEKIRGFDQEKLNIETKVKWIVRNLNLVLMAKFYRQARLLRNKKRILKQTCNGFLQKNCMY